MKPSWIRLKLVLEVTCNPRGYQWESLYYLKNFQELGSFGSKVKALCDPLITELQHSPSMYQEKKQK